VPASRPPLPALQLHRRLPGTPAASPTAPPRPGDTPPQVGQANQAIIELEDEEIAFKGSAEVKYSQPWVGCAAHSRLHAARPRWRRLPLGETGPSPDRDAPAWLQVHAALAAVLYSERPLQRLRAEQQWDIAAEFDGRYSDTAWVAAEKHWPPRLIQALQKFLLLQ